jgi:hypothetical protein
VAKTEDYPVVGSYNNQRVKSIDAERSLNCFEYIDPLGKKPRSLINPSGLINTQDSFGTTGGFRDQFVFKNQEFSIVGSDIYLRTAANIITKLNTLPLATASGYAAIDANTFQVIFVDGVNGYIYDTVALTFVKITDTSFPAAPIDVCSLDGFFVVANGNTNNFQLSSFNQGLVWGPDYTANTGNTFVATSGGSPNLVLTTGTTANYQIGTPFVFNVGVGGVLPVGTPVITAGVTYFVKSVVNATTLTISVTNGGPAITFSTTGTAPIYATNNGQLQQGAITTHPGNIVACRTLHRRLFLFSDTFTEIWENSGIGTNLPFRRNNGLLLEFGTVGAGSVAAGFDYMFFLSQDRDGLGPVMQMAGSNPAAVSNRALDFQLSQYAANPKKGVADCRGFLIKENGLIFYRMNFTKAKHTFVYNVTFSDPQNEQSKLWHEEETLPGNRHPAQTLSYFNGINYVGDYQAGILYILDSFTYRNGDIVDQNGEVTQGGEGEAIRRMRITKAIVPPGYQRTRIDRLQLDLLQGTILNIQPEVNEVDILTEDLFQILTEDSLYNLITETGLIVDNPIVPVVFLSVSKDGGQTYGFKLQGPMGAAGERTFRTLWRKLGVIPRGQGFVIKIEFFDPVPFICMGGSWAYEILPE